jgi:hypothetical protein
MRHDYLWLKNGTPSPGLAMRSADMNPPRRSIQNANQKRLHFVIAELASHSNRQ